MSAPRSPRTEAVLDAVHRCGYATAGDVVDELDRCPPDPGWTTLPAAARSGTVRRYLARLVDAAELHRVSDGRYAAVWHRPAPSAAATPTGPQDPSTQAQEPPEEAPDPLPAAAVPGDGRAFRPFPEQTSPDLNPRHIEERPTMTDTDFNAEAAPPGATSTTIRQADTDASPLAPLLDACRHAPWPAAAHDALAVVEQLDHRRTQLEIEREAALTAADAAEAAEADALVDGLDPSAHVHEAARLRAVAGSHDRAIAALDSRRHAAALAVLDVQDRELTARALTARAAAVAHWNRRSELVAQLADHDGSHWNYAAQRHSGDSANYALRYEAEDAAHRVLAVRATIDDLPLGFHADRGYVTTGGIGTLAGAGGLPPLVEVETISAHDHGREATELVEALRHELDQQTPMP